MKCDVHLHPGGLDASGALFGSVSDYRIVALFSGRGAMVFEIGVGARPGHVKTSRLTRKQTSGVIRNVFNLELGRLGHRRIMVLKTIHPVPAVMFAIVPILWITNRKRRRRSTMICPHCNYDLRATPNQCPECGAVPDPVQRDAIPTLNRRA